MNNENYLQAAIKTAIDDYLATHPDTSGRQVAGALIAILREHIRVWSPPRRDVMDAEYCLRPFGTGDLVKKFR